MKFWLLVLVALMVGRVAVQQCTLYDPRDKIESGMLCLYLGLYEVQQVGSSSRRHLYEVTLSNYNVPTTEFELALCTHSL